MVKIMDNKNIVITAKSPLGYTVICSKDRWVNHIIESTGHPVMIGHEKDVENAISDPDKIYESSQTPKRDVYFKAATYNAYGKDKTMYTKVIVENTKNYSEIKSAWPQPTISGGIGGVIYEKTEL